MPPPAPAPLTAAHRWCLAGLLLLLVAAYFPSRHTPFLFDDLPAITANPAITPLWPPTPDLWSHPAGGVTTTGRPFTAFTFAANHAVHGLDAFGFRAVNLLLHACNGLLLFGLLRRLLAPSPRGNAIALTTAAWWLLHPLATNVVTYVAQRAESLAAAGLLLAAWAFLRAAAAPAHHERRWHALTLVALVAGMAAKETAAAGPVLLLALDRARIAPDWRSLWRERGRWHLAHAGTWLVPLGLMLFTGGRGDTAGFANAEAVTPVAYLATQIATLPHYLRLAVWPVGLVFDYGTPLIPFGIRTLGGLLVLAGGIVGAVLAHRRGVRWPLYLLFTYMLLLAPSSSVIPIATQTLAEHRLYLPLACVLVALALLGQRLSARVAAAAAVAVTLVLAGLTAARNNDFASAERIWADTAAKRPDNARAHANLGIAQLAQADPAAALDSFDRAAELAPRESAHPYHRGLALIALERPAEAAVAYARAWELDPGHAEAANNLGNLLLRSGQPDNAVLWHERATAAKPAWGEAWHNLALSRFGSGDIVGAEQAAATATRILPEDTAVAFTRARIAYAKPDPVAAETRLRQVLELEPSHRPAREALIDLLIEGGQFSAAADVCAELVRLAPADSHARTLLAWLQARSDPGAD